MKDTRRVRLSQWPFVAIFGLAALVLVTGGYLFYRDETRAIRDRKHDELKAIADLKTGQIVAWRNERLDDARFTTKGPFFQEAVARWVVSQNDDALKADIGERLQLVREKEHYDNVMLAAPDGRLLLSLDPDLAELAIEKRQLVARAVADHGPVFGDLFRCPACGRIHLDVAAAILDEEEQPTAVLILRTDPEYYLYPLIQSWPLPSKSAETVLARQDGDEALFLNRLRHRPDPALTLRLPLSLAEIPVVQAVSGKAGLFEGRDYRGVDVLADIRPVPGSPWFIITKVDAAEILAEARYRGKMILLLVALGILMTGSLAAFAFKHRQRNLYKSLYRAERERREAREEIRATLYGIGDGVIATDRASRVTRMNPEAEKLTGWSEKEAMGRSLGDVFRIVNEETRAKVEDPIARVLREGVVVGLANHTLLVARDGPEWPIADSGAPIRDETGAIIGVVLVFRDQTVERAAQKALRESEARFRAIFNAAQDGMFIETPDGYIEDVNPAAADLLGYSREELVRMRISDVVPPEIAAGLTPTIKEDTIIKGTYIETEEMRKNGGRIPVEVSNALVEIAGEKRVIAIIRDITRRKKAEEEREKLQIQLLQAQKMESVGRLAGGVAHDFNNMLGVILGHAELALKKVDPAQPLYGDLQAIRDAAQRSSDLTGQLLAFARKQTVKPQVMDLNDTVGEMLVMLRRLIGENIELIWKPGANLWPVEIDPVQVDQILVNLSANARDAIVGVGRLILETNNTVIDKAYSQTCAGLVAGEYVLLTVSDTGTGMDAETRKWIFEPFFTTRKPGKGTGLGLATIYGIVKQNKGFVYFYSEPGHGTTFRIYLPRARSAIEPKAATIEKAALIGSETILLVEDEAAILDLCKIILERRGYTVLTARTPGEALTRIPRHDGTIDLLITDLVMPEMNGRKLRDKIAEIRPGLKTLYISGYTNNVIAHQGILEAGVQFLQKPFSADTLAAKVREVLNG